ncbi:MAG: PorT family protein [Candidatus Azobacteroides sp.]|nr:PorT family protein [Candidatus Azobacteroides sp.]
MNKIVNIFFFLLLFCFASFELKAQRYFKPELSFGPFAGATLSKVSFTPTVKQDYFVSYIIGFKFRYISEKNLGFLLEPSFSNYGWKENFAEYTDPTLEYSRRISYFELPFLTHVYFGDKKRIFINAGPVARILLSEKESMNFSLENELPPTTNGRDAYGNSIEHTFDYGISAGLGFELQTKKANFLLEGRYYFGLGDIFNNHKRDPYSKSANQNIIITFSYLIPRK